MAPRRKPKELPPQPRHEPPRPRVQDEKHRELDLHGIEEQLRPAFDPECSAELEALRDAFGWLLVDAYERNFTWEACLGLIEKVLETNDILTRVVMTRHFAALLKNTGQSTPNLDATAKALVEHVQANRRWALRHLDLIRGMPLPGEKSN